MLKNIFILSFIFSISFANAQKKEKIKGDKNITFNHNDLEQFDTIEIGDEFVFYLAIDNKYSLASETDNNLHKHIDIKVIDKKLIVNATKTLNSSKPIQLWISCTNDIANIIVKDNAIFNTFDRLEFFNLTLNLKNNSKSFATLKSNYLKIEASDQSEAKLNVSAEKTEVFALENFKLDAYINSYRILLNTSGKSDLNIEGECHYGTFNLKDKSDINANLLTSNQSEINLVDKSKLSLEVTNDLVIEIENDAEFTLFGHPFINLKKFDGNSVLRKKEK